MDYHRPYIRYRQPRLANNAGIMSMLGGWSTQGWDLTFATNHLGPFAFTEALIPYLPDGASIVFSCSGVEDPMRKPAVASGFRGGRYISAEASARGEWKPGSSPKSGFDAYATSKQCNLATVFSLANEIPRLRFNAVEPGFNPGTGLGREANAPIHERAATSSRLRPGVLRRVPSGNPSPFLIMLFPSGSRGRNPSCRWQEQGRLLSPSRKEA